MAAATLSDTTTPNFRTIYEDNVSFVGAYASRRGVPRASVEDVVQDVFLAVHQSLGSFSGTSTLRAWIAGVVRHITLAHVRRNRLSRSSSWLDEECEASRDAVTPAELAERHERVALIVGVLEDMTQLSRQAYWLYEIEDRPGCEVAEVLGVSENTVRVRVRSARRRLRPVVTRFRQSA